MKRSTVNTIMERADDFIRSHGFRLPPFAHLSPEGMKDQEDAIRHGVIDRRLGWDITDFGAGKFDEMGIFLFTVRNGTLAEQASGKGMTYCEKIMISRHDQLCPMHRHNAKSEDIINRGGAKLALKMYESGPDGKLDTALDVPVTTDGVKRVLKGGDILMLEPGESVTLHPGNWHAFWGEGGDVLIGEVSTVNDDENDNIFAKPVGRFSDIEEDVEPLHLLVADYGKVFG